MKGLLKNNYYTVLPNAKIFSAAAVLSGIFVLAIGHGMSWLTIGYMLLVMIGFSFSSLAGIRKKNTTKWSRHKLCAPVRRSDIIKSLFLSQLLWLAAGAAFAGIDIALAVMLHGYPFDRATDVFMLYVAGIGISLFMGAVFFPLFFLGGDERNEIFLLFSLLGGTGIFMGLTAWMNHLFPAGMTPLQIIGSGMMILVCGVLAFAASCPLTVWIFRKKEY